MSGSIIVFTNTIIISDPTSVMNVLHSKVIILFQFLRPVEAIYFRIAIILNDQTISKSQLLEATKNKCNAE